METNLCEFFIGTNVVFNTRGFVQFFAFSTRKQCKVISQCEEKKLPLWPNAQSVLQQQRDSINSKSWFSRRNAFSLPCLSFSFLSCFDLQKKMSFLCELVLYYVENYGFYFIVSLWVCPPPHPSNVSLHLIMEQLDNCSATTWCILCLRHACLMVCPP